MRQQPTQLNEVPWNEQTPEQRQQTLQRQRQAQQQQQQQQQQWAQTQPVQQPRTQPRVNEQPQTRTVQSAPAQPARQSQPPKQTASQQPYQDLLQTPAHTSAAAPKAAPITRAPEAPKATAEKKMNVAGWCNVVHSKAPSRQKASALSWRLKALTPKLPPITAGIAWLSGR